MSHWQTPGQSDEWYTPKYIFDAMGASFDMDVAAANTIQRSNVPAEAFCMECGLDVDWRGFVWMNPPFGGRNGILPWLRKFVEHGNGIALTPDRTSAPWFQWFAPRVDLQLYISPKVKFERPDGSSGKSPSGGTVLHAIGPKAEAALRRASSLGLLSMPLSEKDG